MRKKSYLRYIYYNQAGSNFDGGSAHFYFITKKDEGRLKLPPLQPTLQIQV